MATSAFAPIPPPASAGPAPSAPEARSVADNMKVGLSHSMVVLPHEDAAELDQLLETYYIEFKPTGCHETFLVQQMAMARIRLSRIQRLEARLLTRAVTDPAHAPGRCDSDLLDHLQSGGSHLFLTLQRMATAAERSYHQSLKALLANRREIRNEMLHQRNEQARDFERRLFEYVEAPLPCPPPPQSLRNEAKPPLGMTGIAKRTHTGPTTLPRAV